MDLLESCKMAIATLTANKMRSGLTMLGIIIGNASVIAMIGIGQGAQQLASKEFKNLSPNTLFIVPGSREARNATFDLPKTLVLEDAKAIAKQVPSVIAVAPEINRRELISYRNKTTATQVTGVTPDHMIVRSFEVNKGRFINSIDVDRNKRVVALGSEVANRFFKGQNPIGQQIRIKDISFEIVGVMAEKGSMLGTNQDDSVFIPLTTMAYQLVGKTSPYGIELTWINVAAKDEETVRAAKFQIENLLRLRHKIVDEDDFGVESPKQLLEIFYKITNGLTIMLASIAGISLLVGGIGVMNIMLVSVAERTQEIGLRKAIGAKEQDILAQFLIEAVIVSAAGGTIGIILGVGSVYLIGAISPLTATISPYAILLALGVSSSIGLFFGVIPAQRAAKLDPIVALRSI
ncbi:ABC transporter permease [Aphanothece hegewaldii CCALA 016]|uniref:ABC transporter permease n=1 Tax=Aphanothece hegewaldii CCALA 016 TaxID=2107694 RepID=A0A2T1LV16_9CHRO|nr:ABC transporter permease [Aphanothece hegewaldii]PSF35523.1 ABC transporter permease [Aphanothece hegewaldii CCALA 016]